MTNPGRLRILLVTRTPWERSLGASRVYVELAEELISQGHKVEKFSLEDMSSKDVAASRVAPGALSRLSSTLTRGTRFARAARAFVRANPERFDVIDVNHTDLAETKRSLQFQNLLVARSVAFVPSYRAFEIFAARRWQEPRSLKSFVQKLLFLPQKRQNARFCRLSLNRSDLINVSNRDDEAELRRTLHYGSKVVRFPFGLSEARAEALAGQRMSARARLANETVVFIGTWNQRKGARDWPEIVSRVLARRPSTKFRFLGTDMSADVVQRAFPSVLWKSLEVIPRFHSSELPELLSGATVGAFPGYLEGFGFSVLEKVAAGLPVVAYDSPGPRDILESLRDPWLVERGNVGRFAERVVALLAIEPAEMEARSQEALGVSRNFRWRDIAAETAELYSERLVRLRSAMH